MLRAWRLVSISTALQSFLARYDLGNGVHVLVSRSFAERRHLLSDGREISPHSGGGLGGETPLQLTYLRSLEIAGQRFNDVAATIDRHGNASDVNVGVSILRHCRITTDFAQHAVWLDPTQK